MLQANSRGLTGYYYVGLPDFAESAFALHLLRPGDIFADVGANAGAWTVMASGGVGAFTDAFEPIPASMVKLAANVAANKLEGKVQLHHVGVGSEPDRLRFTTGRDTGNQVVEAGETQEDVLEVPVVTLDKIYRDRCPRLIKIDVEGWELEVIKGARALLQRPALSAFIIETFRHHNLLTPKLIEMESILAEQGFLPVSYHPLRRCLDHVDAQPRVSDNTIYVRDAAAVQARLNDAPAFSILGQRL